jgi:hypothetical protein
MDRRHRESSLQHVGASFAATVWGVHRVQGDPAVVVRGEPVVPEDAVGQKVPDVIEQVNWHSHLLELGGLRRGCVSNNDEVRPAHGEAEKILGIVRLSNDVDVGEEVRVSDGRVGVAKRGEVLDCEPDRVEERDV